MTIRRLLDDLDLSRDRFVNGKPDAILAFAEDVGADPITLLQDSVEIQTRYNRFRGEDINSSFMSAKIRKICPECLREDGGPEAWKHWLLWCFQHVDGCPNHRTRVVEIGDGKTICDLREVIEGRMALQAFEQPEPFSPLPGRSGSLGVSTGSTMHPG